MLLSISLTLKVSLPQGEVLQVSPFKMKWWDLWLLLKEEIDSRLTNLGLSFDVDITDAMRSF